MKRWRRKPERADYGLDAPRVVRGSAALGLLGLALLVVYFWAVPSTALLGWALWCIGVGLGVAAPMCFSSRYGKVLVRDRVLRGLALKGHEDVLDLGCGSGLMLLGAVRRLPHGWGTGVDLWRAKDQARSSRTRLLLNAQVLGVADRVRVIDGDIASLPFPDATFDVVFATLAMHNLHPAARRDRSFAEACRVLKPGGQLVVVDIAGTRALLARAHRHGLTEANRSAPVFGIFPPARIFTGTKLSG